MFDKLECYKRIFLFLSVLAFSIPAYFVFENYQYDSFKRAYNDGTLFEQLDVLMNTTRYVNKIRDAGYHIDDYNLKMTKRIVSLKTKGELAVEILSPDETVTMVTVRDIDNRPNVTATLVFNQQLELTYIGYMTMDGSSNQRLEFDENTTQKLSSEMIEEVKIMLNDIYKFIYSG